MILTVTLNAAIDKRYVVKEFQVGEVKPCSRVYLYTWWKRTECIKACIYRRSRSGSNRIRRWTCRKLYRRSLKPFGIKSEFYHMDAESRSCINIWTKEHVQTEFLEPGFTVSAEDFEGFCEKFKTLVPKADVSSNVRKCTKGTGRNCLSETGIDCKRGR